MQPNTNYKEYRKYGQKRNTSKCNVLSNERMKQTDII